tara:strand:- start:1080 stop:1214 length:135 start_codon:yes stop_codon:yes gene_type:complete
LQARLIFVNDADRTLIVVTIEIGDGGAAKDLLPIDLAEFLLAGV